MSSRFLLVLLLALGLAGCARPLTTIVLVRHADVDAAGQDPPLNAAGQQRAQDLAAALDDAGLTAIYTSDLQRTQQTAAPAAARESLSPLVFAVNNGPAQQAADIAAHIRENFSGRTVLVVGHSNTVPLVIEALGFSPASPIAADEFDRMFIVRRLKDDPVTLIEVRYGQ